MLQEGSDIVGLLGDIGYVGVPSELAVDGDAQILSTANLPQDSAVDVVVTVYRILLPHQLVILITSHLSGLNCISQSAFHLVDDPGLVAE